MDTDELLNGLFGGDFGSMTKRMEKMLSEMGNLSGTGVRTYGYTMYQDSDGNRHVREFGGPAVENGAFHGPIDESLTDICLDGGTVRAVVEIPGVSLEDIVIDATKDTLSINIDNGRKRFSKELTLPCDVDPDSAVAEYNNGILEVTLLPAETAAMSAAV